MTSFSWKKKSGENIKRSASAAFEKDSKDDNDDLQVEGVDWLTLAAPNRKVICLEDAVSKSSRLKNEGAMLAESDRYWEAIKKWDEALQFTACDETLYEMKAQALLALFEVFPAMTMAEKAIQCNPTWFIGYQTLGRVQLGMGEVKQALKNFSKAVHINPSDMELWKEDLLWAFSLIKQKQELEKSLQEEDENSKIKVTELIEEFEDSNESENDAADHEIGSSSGMVNQKEELSDIKHLPKNFIVMRDK